MAVKFPIKIHRHSSQCKVTFKFDDGTVYLEKLVKKNEKVEKPTDPTKEGFVFKSWQLNGEDFDFETPIVEDIELIAVFQSDADFWVWDGVLTDDDQYQEWEMEGRIAFQGLHKISDDVYEANDLIGKICEYDNATEVVEKYIIDKTLSHQIGNVTMLGGSAIALIAGRGTIPVAFGPQDPFIMDLDGTYFGIEGWKDGPRGFTSRLEKATKTPIWQRELNFESIDGNLLAQVNEPFPKFDEINTQATYTFTCEDLNTTFTGQFEDDEEYYKIGNEGIGGFLIKKDNTSYLITFPEGEAGLYNIEFFWNGSPVGPWYGFYDPIIEHTGNEYIFTAEEQAEEPALNLIDYLSFSVVDNSEASSRLCEGIPVLDEEDGWYEIEKENSKLRIRFIDNKIQITYQTKEDLSLTKGGFLVVKFGTPKE